MFGGKKDRLPPLVRVSIGSSMLLELIKGNMDVKPTTIYLLTYHKGRCLGNCSFCSQARESTSKEEMLARVTWPFFNTETVLKKLGEINKDQIQRICIQTINYPNVFEEVSALVSSIHTISSIPISLSCHPLSREEMKHLYSAGLERIGIPLDASTETIFERVKGIEANGPYLWRCHMNAIKDAILVFGRSKVSTHLIVGLGERDYDLLKLIQKMFQMGVYPGLFAMTPIPGTKFENMSRPCLERYHRIQLAHHLIISGIVSVKKMTFDSEGRLKSFGVAKHSLMNIVESGLPFRTSGCPGCNRPYYNERPGGEIYNYPTIPTLDEVERIKDRLFGRTKS